MHMFKQMKILLIVALAVCVTGALAYAEGYPNKPIKLVVPYPPGGGIDRSARVLAVGLSQQLGQSICDDNQGDASVRTGHRSWLRFAICLAQQKVGSASSSSPTRRRLRRSACKVGQST
jgi:hypothetical protein